MAAIPDHTRPHHWGFANAWLRRSFQRIPETLMSALAHAPSAEPLTESWINFGQTLEEEDRLEAEPMDVSTFSAVDPDGRWYLAVIEMPEPLRDGEAHRIVLAVSPPDDQLDPDREDDSPDPETRQAYFVLERDADGRATRLIRWRADESTPTDLTPADDPQAVASAVTDLLT